MTATILNQTIDQAFEREVASLLRRRFVWLCGTWLMLTVLFYLGSIAWPVYRFASGARFTLAITDVSSLWLFLFGTLGRLAILGFALWLVYRRCRTQREILRVAFWTLILIGISCIVVRINPESPWPSALWNTDSPTRSSRSSVASAASSIALAHLFMSMFLPWTPRQSAKPLLILAPVWVAAALAYEGMSTRVIFHGLVVGPGLSGIGLFICWVRHSQLWETVETSVLRRHFQEAQRELIDARRIHESRFPAPISSGAVVLNYAYEPMREIGGDFLHARRDENGRLHAALIDVTGHGITAALAVNRIDGELARLVAENPLLTPDELLAGLNRYIHLTMARHSIYATAFCFCVEPNGRVRWANGGHPPAFLRHADGRVEALASTAFILGAAPPEAFDPDAQELVLAPGDTIIVYTDGASEAVDGRGRQFGIRGLQQTIERWQPTSGIDLIPFLPETIKTFRAGVPQDDVLFTITRWQGATMPTPSQPPAMSIH